MTRLPTHSFLVPVLGIVLGLFLATGSVLAEEAVRPEVGKPLQAAESLIKQQKYPDALAKLRVAQSVGDLTPYETSLIDQLRGIAAAASGDHQTAAHAFEAVLAYGHQPGAARLAMIQAVIGQYYQLADYPKVVSWVKHYRSEGGTASETLALLPQAYYLANDFANAAQSLRDMIKDEEHLGRVPTESQLQVLANSSLKLNDRAGYNAALERLAASYPKPEYWVPLLQAVTARAGFADRLALDGDRLALATGVLTTAPRYVEFAERALQAELPGEAKVVLERGFSAGILGGGADGERHRRLRTLATARAAEDLPTLTTTEREAAALKDGNGLVNTGLAWLGFGDAAKAADLIGRGIAKGGLKRPDEAQLHLGIARLAAGQKDQAIKAFQAVQGGDAADLARLWELHARAPNAGSGTGR
jgi:tetratricopeptide (TPR) repeat protein